MLNLDTHILLHALAGTLTSRETKLLSEDTWSLSAISLWEIAKLAQLRRIEVDLDAPELRRILSGLYIWPITFEVCRAIRELDFRGDPADELIAATSLVNNVPLVTRNRAIRKSRKIPLARS